jgi:hypothetical protein
MPTKQASVAMAAVARWTRKTIPVFAVPPM